MDASNGRFAYRCLPLLIANQHGWFLGSPAGFSAWWNGGSGLADTVIRFDGDPDDRVTSHFGSGIITFTLSYLFRTPPGVNLLVKGPSNRIKDGIQPLEAIVETDWAPAPFTMNWKLTRPNHVVTFEPGEPICMLVPLQRSLIETLEPRCEPLTDTNPLHTEYATWSESRSEFLTALHERQTDAIRDGWQKDYFRGRTPTGRTCEDHQTKLKLGQFTGSTTERPSAADPGARASIQQMAPQ